MKNINLKGEFWVPGNLGHRVHGTVSVTEILTFKLKLRGDLCSSTDDFRNFEPVIYGRTQNGEVTLENCVLRRHTRRRHDLTSSKYEFNSLYLGKLIEKPVLIETNEVIIDFPYLQGWVDKTGVDWGSADYTPDRSSVSINKLEPIMVPFSDGKLSIFFEKNPKIDRFGVGISQIAKIHLTLDEPSRINSLFEKYILPIQDFLNVVNGRINIIRSLRVFQKYTFEDTKALFNPLDSFHILRGGFFRNVSLKKSEAKYHPNDALFEFRHVETRFPQMLSGWLSNSARLEPARNLFRQARSADRLFVQLRMLLIAQGLEYFHGIRHDSWNIPVEICRPLKKRLVSNAPKSHQQWLRDGLQHAGQKTLRHRIAELASEASEVMHPIGIDPEAFAKAVSNSRNYYTHFDLRNKAKSLHDEELAWLTECLLTLFESCFLSELGFSYRDQSSLLMANNRYNFLLHNQNHICELINKERKAN